MSPTTCSQGTSLHAVTFMLREVDLPLILWTWALTAWSCTHPSNFMPWRSLSCLSDRVQCMCMSMTTITLHIQNLTLSSLKWSPHKHWFYIYNYTSADENHLCGASLRESHKISLKAQRHGASTCTCSSRRLCSRICNVWGTVHVLSMFFDRPPLTVYL